jgi:uncharacterized membrane protein YcaP (DUF421 family)
MDPQELLLIAGRTSLVYVFLLVLVRLLGKREIGTNSAFDLVVALILGEMVDEAIFGDVTLLQFGVAAVVVAIWHFVNSFASYRSKTINDLTGGTPTVLLQDGKIIHDALAKERMHEDELHAELRLAGVSSPNQVKTATLESSGKVSVIQKDGKKASPKSQEPDKAV